MSKTTTNSTLTHSNTSKHSNDLKSLQSLSLSSFRCLLYRAKHYRKRTLNNSIISYNTLILNALLSNGKCHIVAEFKDYLIKDDHSEFLKRSYKKAESTIRIKKLIEFYNATSVIYPNYTPIIEAKYIYKNVMQKQKVIDQIQEYEDKQMMLKQNKTKVKSLVNVFDDIAYDAIMNQSNSVIVRMLGLVKTKDVATSNDELLRDKEERLQIEQLITYITNCEDKVSNIKLNENEDSFNTKKKLTIKVNEIIKRSSLHHLPQRKTSVTNASNTNNQHHYAITTNESTITKLKVNTNSNTNTNANTNINNKKTSNNSSTYRSLKTKNLLSLSLKSISPPKPSHKHNLSIKLNNCGTSRNNYRNNQNGLQSYLSTKQSNFYSSSNNQLSNMLMPKIEVRPQSKTKRIYKLGSMHMKTQSDAMMFNSPNSKGTTKSKRFIKGNGTLGYNLISSPSNVPATERGSGYKKKKMMQIQFMEIAKSRNNINVNNNNTQLNANNGMNYLTERKRLKSDIVN